jgi:hypothetical protein
MKKLYRILTPLTFPHIPTEDRKCDEAAVAHILAETDEEVFGYIERRFYQGDKYQDPGWCAFLEEGELTREEIIEMKGDYTVQEPDPPITLFLAGEVYRLGFRWEDLGEVSPEEIAVLQRLGILSDVNAGDGQSSGECKEQKEIIPETCPNCGGELKKFHMLGEPQIPGLRRGYFSCLGKCKKNYALIKGELKAIS